MMNIRKTTLLILLACLFNPAHAVLVGGKDWLQVTDTAGYSWNDFNAIFDNSTGLCNVSGCLLGGSVDLTGYTWASTTEVAELFQAYGAGDGTAPSEFGQNVGVSLTPGAFDAMFADFTPTVASTSFQQINGLSRESALYWYTGQVVAVGLEASRYIGNLDSTNDEYWRQAFSMNYTNSNTGGWLYKTAAVPEPASLLLLFSGFISLRLMRRKQLVAVA